ncbi:MAG: imidazole glycerol phosphate synthase subunit HisH [Planctomycetota bacterium]
MVSIIDTGVANIRSLQASFDRLGQPWQLTTASESILDSDYVVLPGVGAFGAAVEQIDRLGIRNSITGRIESGKPTLCICLGMQLLCSSSLEAPGAHGLGIIPSQIVRLPDHVQVPQLGWNTVAPARRTTAYFEAGEAYFANSFCLDSVPDDWNHAVTEYGCRFVSSFWRGRVLACQFHPELSGAWGENVIENWLAGTPIECGGQR